MGVTVKEKKKQQYILRMLSCYPIQYNPFLPTFGTFLQLKSQNKSKSLHTIDFFYDPTPLVQCWRVDLQPFSV